VTAFILPIITAFFLFTMASGIREEIELFCDDWENGDHGRHYWVARLERCAEIRTRQVEQGESIQQILYLIILGHLT
jgi:hypothetical protein